jgi:hypothetical protein
MKQPSLSQQVFFLVTGAPNGRSVYCKEELGCFHGHAVWLLKWSFPAAPIARGLDSVDGGWVSIGGNSTEKK